MATRILLAWLVAFGSVGGAALAQPTQGQVVFTSTGGVYYATATLGARSGYVAPSSINFMSCQVNYGNSAVVTSDSAGRMYRVRPTGSITTIATFAQGWCSAMDLDQDRSMVTAMAFNSGLRRLTPGGTHSRFGTFAGSVNGICRNTKTGHFIGLTSAPTDAVIRIDRVTGATSTIASLPHLPTGICYMPDVDRYAVTMSTTIAPLVILTTSGASVRTGYLGGHGGSSVTYNENTRELYVGTAGGRICRLDNAGVLLNSTDYTNDPINGIDIWDDQNISLNTTGAPGSTVGVAVRFARSPSRAYCLTLALSLSPGIRIPGAGYLNVAPDWLFRLTACTSIPGLTTGFAGVTNSTGGATGTFKLPATLPSGMRIYCTGAAVNAGLPGGLDLGNTEVVRVN